MGRGSSCASIVAQILPVFYETFVNNPAGSFEQIVNMHT